MSKFVTVAMDKPAFGFANPRRGKTYHELAVCFAKRFPINTEISQDAFSSWVEELVDSDEWGPLTSALGLYKVPTDVPTNSDAWKAHLQRRSELRYNINKASEHPRMNDEPGLKAFSIRCPRTGVLVVVSPEVAISEADLPKALKSLLSTERKKLRYLQQSVDFTALPPYMKAQCEGISDDIDTLAGHVLLQTSAVEKSLGRFKIAMEKEVAAGNITPINGGIKQLIARKMGEHDIDAA